MKHKTIFLLILFAAGAWALSLTRTGTGLVYGDDFNGTALNSAIWNTWGSEATYGLEVKVENGEVAVFGTVTQSTGNHVGIKSDPCPLRCFPGDAVMAGRLRVPVWTDTCVPLTPPWYHNQNYMEFHFCNVSPDINTSIGMRTNCLNSSQTDTVPHIGSYYPTAAQTAEVRTGIGLFISYNDLAARHFVKFSDTVVQTGSASTNLENCKRMELKAYDLYAGVYLDYRYDWACVYRQPLDYPVVFVLDSALRNGTDRTLKVTHSGVVSQGTGQDTIRVYLPEDQMYPAAAQVELADAGQQVLGQAAIAYDGQLDGLFPGDTFLVDTLSTRAQGAPALAPMDLEIFPNPFRQTAWILPGTEAGPAVVSIFDLAGRRKAHFRRVGRGGVVWDAGNMAPSIYIVRAETGNRIIVKKAVLAR
jgi:hypothetical protein